MARCRQSGPFTPFPTEWAILTPRRPTLLVAPAPMSVPFPPQPYQKPGLKVVDKNHECRMWVFAEVFRRQHLYDAEESAAAAAAAGAAAPVRPAFDKPGVLRAVMKAFQSGLMKQRVASYTVRPLSDPAYSHPLPRNLPARRRTGRSGDRRRQQSFDSTKDRRRRQGLHVKFQAGELKAGDGDRQGSQASGSSHGSRQPGESGTAERARAAKPAATVIYVD